MDAKGSHRGSEAPILIVDHELDLVETCVRLLARQGYPCLTASTGQQGITLIDQGRPSLVLTDLYLPDVDGRTVLRHARELSPPIPGILMTAYTSPQTNSHAYDAGAILYLPKPFSNIELIETVERALR